MFQTTAVQRQWFSHFIRDNIEVLDYRS